MLAQLLVAVLFLGGQCHKDRPTVVTPLGKIRGHHKVSFDGRIFSAFEGIPYAKPPIGELRFEEPVAAEGWDGVWEGNFLCECLQSRLKNRLNTSVGLRISGEEDCLYINVYVPRDRPDAREKLDVIFHIHGGAFSFDSAHVYAHPEFLMDRNIIFVSFNYRLGILGFLSTEDEALPGNNGLKDQVMALKWVRDNIASFGGNVSSVTLTGASVGGTCVQLHYLSPMSRGLFHRGWSTSGSALQPASIRKKSRAKTESLANALGCPVNSSKSLVKCLKQRPYGQIAEKIILYYQCEFDPLVLIGPVVEKGPNAFISEDPYELLVDRQVQDLPWVSSNVAHEGAIVFRAFNWKIINDVWNGVLPCIFGYSDRVPKQQWNSTAEKIKDFYLGKDNPFSDANKKEFIQMVGDGMFTYSNVKATILQAAATNASVYYYYLHYTGDQSDVIAHSQDNKYFFYKPYGETYTQNELKMKDFMIDLLVSYARNGKPVINGIDWEPTGHDELTYLNISSFKLEGIKLQKAKHLIPDDFWNTLYYFRHENS